MISLTPIERLHFDPRASSALIGNGIDYVEHLVLYEYDDLLTLPGIGKVMADKICKALASNGYSLTPHLHPRERHRHRFEEKYADSHPDLFRKC